MRTWDRGVQLQQTIGLLQAKLRDATNPEYTYLAVLLTQAINGCRVGEAIEAIKKYAETGSHEQRVRVEKRRDEAERLVIIPSDVSKSLDSSALDKARVKMYAKRKLGINTHSLRYAWITAQAQNNVNPAIIAAITGHKNLNILMHYIQKKQGEEYLRQLIQTTRRVS